MNQPDLVARLSQIRRKRNRPDGISLIKKCKQCKRNYRKKLGLSWKLWINRIYCSKDCQGIAFGKAQQGRNNPNFGKSGSASPVWKGDGIGYSGIHRWLSDQFGKADRCENQYCKGKSKTYEWALLQGEEYERRRENFWQLCHSCHKKYDYKLS